MEAGPRVHREERRPQFYLQRKGRPRHRETQPGEIRGNQRTHLLNPVNRDPSHPVVWSRPAFANKSIYARNDKEIVCVSLAADKGR
jgi:hypothetical protein